MVNKVILIGNLGKDPEIRVLDGGISVARMSIATNESFKDKAGEWQNKAEWHDIVMWRELAERAEKQLKKGHTVYIEGKLTHRKYQDKDGQDRYITEVVANTFRSMEKKEKSDTFPSANDAPASRTESQGARENTAPPPTTDDDLPF